MRRFHLPTGHFSPDITTVVLRYTERKGGRDRVGPMDRDLATHHLVCVSRISIVSMRYLQAFPAICRLQPKGTTHVLRCRAGRDDSVLGCADGQDD
jgi:hypothetical protein